MTDTPSPERAPTEPSTEALIDALILRGVDYLAGYLAEKLGHMDNDGASAPERAQLLKLALDRFRAARMTDPPTEPSKEALEAAREALDNNLADTVRDIETVVALALDRFHADASMRPPKRWRSWRVCPACGSRATKIFDISAEDNPIHCQRCDHRYSPPRKQND